MHCAAPGTVTLTYGGLLPPGYTTVQTLPCNNIAVTQIMAGVTSLTYTVTATRTLAVSAGDSVDVSLP